MQISLPELLDGFKQSHQRFQVAKNNIDEKQMFITLFEALNWVVSIDDRLRDRNSNWQDQFGKQGETVKAIRFARNRVHHQWAYILHIRDGVTLPVRLPTPLFDWVWIAATQLPAVAKRYEDPKGEKLYRQLLENKPVRFSLLEMENLFDKVIP